MSKKARHAHLPQHQASIGIFDRGKSSVRVDVDEGQLLTFTKLDELVFEGDAQFFEDDVYFAANRVSYSWPERYVGVADYGFGPAQCPYRMMGWVEGMSSAMCRCRKRYDPVAGD